MHHISRYSSGLFSLENRILYKTLFTDTSGACGKRLLGGLHNKKISFHPFKANKFFLKSPAIGNWIVEKNVDYLGIVGCVAQRVSSCFHSI